MNTNSAPAPTYQLFYHEFDGHIHGPYPLDRIYTGLWRAGLPIASPNSRRSDVIFESVDNYEQLSLSANKAIKQLFIDVSYVTISEA